MCIRDRIYEIILEIVCSCLRERACIERTHLWRARPCEVDSALNRMIDHTNWLRSRILTDEVIFNQIRITDVGAIVSWNGELSSVAVHSHLVVKPRRAVGISGFLQQVPIGDPIAPEWSI